MFISVLLALSAVAAQPPAEPSSPASRPAPSDATGATAETPVASSNAAGAELTYTPEQISELIKALGDPDWSTRQRASDDLFFAGPAAYPPLKEEFRRTRNYEVRRRIHYIVELIYFFHGQKQGNGFLGIQYNAANPLEGDRIRVIRVVPGSGAERAGLRAGDLVLSIDGTRISNGTDGFRRMIEERKPGTRIALVVLRDQRSLQLSAVLGPRRSPDDLYKMRERFVPWWRAEFDPDGFFREFDPPSVDRAWTLE